VVRLSRRGKTARWISLLLGGAGLFVAGGWPGPLGGPLPLIGTATPTADRLAKPTLPANPSPADRGSQVFWLDCMPCHGDRGQGLTEEFRQAYPAEDRNCWDSGCHGARPYDNGFTLPFQVPAVIGPGALARFPSAAALDAFVRAAMPRQKPGSLTPEQYSQVVAFLARQNGWPYQTPTPGPAAEAAAGAATASGALPQAAATPAHAAPGGRATPTTVVLLTLAAVAAGGLGLLAYRRRRKPPA